MLSNPSLKSGGQRSLLCRNSPRQSTSWLFVDLQAFAAIQTSLKVFLKEFLVTLNKVAQEQVFRDSTLPQFNVSDDLQPFGGY